LIRRIVNTNIGAGDGRDCCFSRVSRISVSGVLTALDHSEAPAALAAGDHYREMAGKLRELARLARMPGIRKELADLAKHYDRRGDHLDRRPR
jgi:hypothetical protein